LSSSAGSGNNNIKRWFRSCLDGLRESDEAVLEVEAADEAVLEVKSDEAVLEVEADGDADLEVEAGVDDVSSKPDLGY
jgi:hypothetical protein